MLLKIGRVVFVIASVAAAVALTSCSQGTGATATPAVQVSPTVSAASPSGGQTATPFPGSATPQASATVATGGPTSTPSSTGPTATSTAQASSAPSPTPASAAPDPAATGASDDFSLFRGAQLIAQDGTLLGELVPASESFDSVCNPDGDFGSSFSPTSIFNPDSDYGGQFGAQSPFNGDSTQPPAIVLGVETLGRLTVSPFVENSVHPGQFLEQLGCQATE